MGQAQWTPLFLSVQCVFFPHPPDHSSFLWATTSSQWQSWASPETPLNWALHLRPCSQKLEFHVIFTTKRRWGVLTLPDRTGKWSSEWLKWLCQGLRDRRGQKVWLPIRSSKVLYHLFFSSLMSYSSWPTVLRAQVRVYLNPEPMVLHFATCSPWKEVRSESYQTLVYLMGTGKGGWRHIVTDFNTGESPIVSRDMWGRKRKFTDKISSKDRVPLTITLLPHRHPSSAPVLHALDVKVHLTPSFSPLSYSPRASYLIALSPYLPPIPLPAPRAPLQPWNISKLTEKHPVLKREGN